MELILLKSKSSDAWLESVLDDLNSFFLDHLAEERKAAATGMMLLERFSDVPGIQRELPGFIREEIAHFRQMERIRKRRGLHVPKDEKDRYIRSLLGAVRRKEGFHLLDRLILAAIVEARGAERFALISKAIGSEELARFYREIAMSEERHVALFFNLASELFAPRDVALTLERFIDFEDHALRKLHIRPRLH